MWFKNLRIYRLTRPIDITPETLEEKLAEHSYRPCTNLEFSRYGWVPPLGKHGTLFTHAGNGHTMICARKQEKILPPAAINEMVEDKILELEARQDRSVYRKEKRDIKETVIHTLLPRALTRSAQTYACFSTVKNLLIIDAASATKAEEFLEHLRIALGELPVVPLTCHGDPAEVMTRWLKNSTAKGFDLDNECDLRNPLESKNIIRCKNQELESEEIMGHLKAGKRVISMAINWKEAIRFVLNEDFSLKRVRFEDSIQKEADTEADDFASQFDQDFAIMTLQLGFLLDELLEAFGGINRDK
jgi:recombination associated protein RdgC